MPGAKPGRWPSRGYKALVSSSANALCGPPALFCRRMAPLGLRARRGGRSPIATGPVPCGPAPAAPAPEDGIGLPPGRPPGPDPGPDPGPCPFGLGGCAGLARSKRSSKGARSKRRMIAFISSAFGASINAKPLDSCVSGLRITLIASATKFSAVSQPLISSAVTQAGKLPRNTVKLIR